jgi:prepilin-type N-terminal cleavage/methylation domain-containing protein
MASSSIRGFTLLESAVVLALFVGAVLIATQIYFNLMRSAVLAQNYQLALDNFRFGSEKVWNEIKNGNNFNPSTSSIEFFDRRCRKIKIYSTTTNLVFEINNQSNLLFDSDLVELQSFNVYYDNPTTSEVYFQKSHKIFLINYKVILKTKTTQIPFETWQTVAPSNSVFVINPCQ